MNTTISSRIHRLQAWTAGPGRDFVDRLADHGATRHAAEKPLAMFAIAWPTHSRFLLLFRVGQVIDDGSRHHGFQRRPTTARWPTPGMILSVSRFNGTSGSRNTGRLSGNWLCPPTVRMSRPRMIATAVSTTMATREDGTTR